MTYSVLLTQGAERDLEEIFHFVAERDGDDAAGELLETLVTTCESLHRSPERGSYPKQLLAIGMTDFRQLLAKPYRLIYRLAVDEVIVYLIAHERRDFQTLLEQRLLR